MGCGEISGPDILVWEVGPLKVGSGTQTRILVFKISASALRAYRQHTSTVSTYFLDMSSWDLHVERETRASFYCASLLFIAMYYMLLYTMLLFEVEEEEAGPRHQKIRPR